MEPFLWGLVIGLVGGGVVTRLYAQRLIDRARAETEHIRATAGEAIRKAAGR